MTGEAAAKPSPDHKQVINNLSQWSRELGFQKMGVARRTIDTDIERYQDWLSENLHGSMAYLERNIDKRSEPAALHDGTISVISFRIDYLHETPADAQHALAQSDRAYISRYALGRDYHKTIRQRLGRLAERLAAIIGPFGYRVFTDSAPVLEKPLARNAGLGWLGKHTNVVDPEDGSMFFIGEIFTDLALPESADEVSDHCGSCRRCLDVCPTQAFVAPYVLDARRCISYLTIESKAPIPEDLRPLVGNRVFGCDDCQLVCPWNRYAKISLVDDFKPRHGLDRADLLSLFELDEAQFDNLTRGSALRRISYAQWSRNLAVALGNAPQSAAIKQALSRRKDDPDPLVREHVAWALSRQQSETNGNDQ